MIKKFSILILIILAAIGLFACGSNSESPEETADLPVVYSNTEEFTDFDYWLMTDVGIGAAPAHIIIKEGKITNFVDFAISYDDLKKVYDTENMAVDLWPDPLDGKYYLKDFNILILKRVNCEVCKEQEEEFEADILEGFKDKKILIYYIASENPDCPGGCD